MYRVIVADDEHHVVGWIVDLLNSKLPDLDVQQGNTGLDVLRTSESMAFDLAILDIMMPGLNGIETAKKLLAKFPNCKILLLTGYEEFDLIYQVNHIKNIRYSLKTETDEQIVRKVQEMINELEEEQRHRQIIDAAARKDLLMRHFEQRGMLFDIIFESPSTQDIQAKFLSYGSQLALDSKHPVNVTLIQFPHHDTTQHVITNDLLLQLYRNLEGTVQQFFRFALLDTNKDCVLLLTQPKGSLDSSNCATVLKAELDRGLVSIENLQQVIRFFISNKSCPWRKISQRYNSLLQYCRGQSVENTAAPIIGTIIDTSDHNDSYHLGMDTTEGKFSQFLQKLSASLVQNNSENFQENIHCIRNLVPNLYKMCESCQAELRGQFALVFINYINLHHLQNELDQKLSFAPLYRAMSTQDWYELITYTQRLSIEIFALSKEKGKRDNVRTVHNICGYIEDHLSENLSVNRLAEVFNYNPSYISRLFKQIQGEPLSQHLKSVRLNRAKDLLRTTNLSIQEIAVSVGFDTVQYFSMVFRKEIGMTPKSFRNAQ